MDGGFDRLRDELSAPWILWPEARSVLHRARWHGWLPDDDANAALERLENASIRPLNPDGLGRAAWAIADELGRAKTYDAEYLALAQLTDAALTTLDNRMRAAAQRLGIEVLAP